MYPMVTSGPKKYNCDICFKGFTRSADLKRHVLIHTNERPYQCQTCGYRFVQKGHLKRHLKSKHDREPTEAELKEVPDPDAKIKMESGIAENYESNDFS